MKFSEKNCINHVGVLKVSIDTSVNGIDMGRLETKEKKMRGLGYYCSKCGNRLAETKDGLLELFGSAG